MSNPQRAKGTVGENAVLEMMWKRFPNRIWRRAPASSVYDIYNDLVNPKDVGQDVIKVLATRPDRGQWLFIIRPSDLGRDPNRAPCTVEVKRRRSFSHHTLFNKEVL